MRRRLLPLAFLLPLLACAEDEDAPPPEHVDQLAIGIRDVDLKAGDLHGLRLLGAVALSADHPRFGGFSGLVVRKGRMIAVSDMGWWLIAPVSDSPAGIRPGAARFLRMRDADGIGFEKRGGDAEGLTIAGARTAVSFERDHRVALYKDAEAGGEIRDRRFERMAPNGGLEALATLPDGRLLAIGEAALEGGFPMFLMSPDGEVASSRLPVTGRHAVTGADVGPDGRLYVVLRDYVPLVGVSIRIHRYRLGDDGFPDPASRTVLAAFEGSGGIDNMEGISVWTDRAGRTRLTLIADDNYNALQRTLVVDFEVEG